MRPVIIAIVAIVLLAAGGGGAYFFLGNADASGGEEVQAAKSESNLEHLVVTYVEMPPILLPIIDREGVTQTISIVISLQVSDDAKAEQVKLRLPKLADAYLSDMYGALSKEVSMQSGVIKVSTLKSRLVRITNKVLGKDFVDDVLLQVLQQHQV